MVDAHKDLKVEKLCREFHSIGYATFFLLLEIIGKEGQDGVLSLEKCSCTDIAYCLHEDPVIIEKVLARAVELELFVMMEKQISCPRLANGYSDEWSSRRRRQHMLDILEKSKDVANVVSKIEEYREKYADRIKDVVTHLNVRTGKQYRWQAKDNQLIITARIKDGYTVEDLRQVIDNMCDLWLGDEKMEFFLRPITLFGRSKIEGYLNANKGLAAKMRSIADGKYAKATQRVA